MPVLIIAGWLAMLTLAGMGVVTGVMASAWKERAPAASLAAWTASAGSCCATACLAAALGAVSAWGAIILAAAAAVLVIAAVAKQVSSDEKATPLGVLWDAVTIVRPAFKGAWQRMRDGKRPPDEVAARRGRRSGPLPLAAVASPDRRSGPRRAAPPPPLPAADADPAPAPGGPRFAVVTGIIPPDHAAAHQRIASFEPDGFRAHADFLAREARGFAGYSDAFAAYADGLIHGPGVPPPALRATFDFADGFSDVSAGLHLALKRFHDYFAGHLEWAESHDPTRDGHWTIRE